MKRSLFFSLFLSFLSIGLMAESSSAASEILGESSSNDLIDELFQDAMEMEQTDDPLQIEDLFEDDVIQDEESVISDTEEQVETSESEDKTEEKKKPVVQSVLKDLTENTEITLKGGIAVKAGYSGGWTDTDFTAPYEQSGVLTTSANLRLNIKVGTPLRLFMKFVFAYPDFDFDMSEIFIDYNLNDVFLARIGRETITWGVSRAYPFVNLTARLPDDFSTDDDDTDTISLRFTVPIGAGSIQALAFSRMGFIEDDDAPLLYEIGYGGLYNFFLWGIDGTVGLFWHNELDTRIFYSAQTTLFRKLEIYSEGLVAIYDNTANDYNFGFGINAGFFIDFFNRNLEINGEYYYNGEDYYDPASDSETEDPGDFDLMDIVNTVDANRSRGDYHSPCMDIKGKSYDLIPGHNIHLGIAGYLWKRKLKLYAQWLYNFDDNTGLIIPGVDFKIMDYLSLSLKTPIIHGSEEGEYYVNNPDTLDRTMAFVITAKFSGKF